MKSNFELLVPLWKNYNKASSLLTEAMGGTANEVGEFAEILVTKYYMGTQLRASNKSADIETSGSGLIQVKSRKLKKIAATRLNVIRSWDFDILVVVIFGKEGDVLKAIAIDSVIAKGLSIKSAHQNGDILTTNKQLLDHDRATDITKDLQNLLDEMTERSFE